MAADSDVTVRLRDYLYADTIDVDFDGIALLEEFHKTHPEDVNRFFKDSRYCFNLGATILTILCFRNFPLHVITRWCALEGVDIDALDARGRSPLVRACCQMHWNVVEILLEAGADPNCGFDKPGRTAALELCIQNAPSYIVKKMFEEGADIRGHPEAFNKPMALAHDRLNNLAERHFSLCKVPWVNGHECEEPYRSAYITAREIVEICSMKCFDFRYAKRSSRDSEEKEEPSAKISRKN